MKFPPIAVLVPLLLMGCASSTKPCAECVPPPPIPANLMAECQALPLLPDGSFPAVSGHLAATGLLYANCAARHNLLVRVLKDREKKAEK